MEPTRSTIDPCRACGAPLPHNAPFGHCPRCLLELGFGPLADESQNVPPRTRLFGEYELLEPPGRGGMGVVYKARQVSLNRMVALKTLSPHALAFPGIAERIQVEAEAAGSLGHPNIVTIYDVGEHAGQPFFSMELVEGAGMDRFIELDGFHLKTPGQENKESSKQRHATIARLMSQITRAVDYAH